MSQLTVRSAPLETALAQARRCPVPGTPSGPSAALAGGLALGVGIVAGIAGLLAENAVDSRVWMSIFHRLAPWVAVAVLVGFALRGRPGPAAIAGLVAELGLVAGYYGAEALLGSQSLDVHSTVAYAVLALVTGPVYGTAGALVGADRCGRRTRCLGAVVGACLADGVRVITAVLAIGVHVVPSLLVGMGFVVVALYVVRLVARSRSEAITVLAAGLAFCALVILGLDVLLR